MTIKIQTYDIIQNKKRPPGQPKPTPARPMRKSGCTQSDPVHQRADQATSENVSAQKEPAALSFI